MSETFPGFVSEAWFGVVAPARTPQAIVDKLSSSIRGILKLGDVQKPLLVSVRSGARASMPGMLDTVLNLGINDEVARGVLPPTSMLHISGYSGLQDDDHVDVEWLFPVLPKAGDGGDAVSTGHDQVQQDDIRRHRPHRRLRLATVRSLPDDLDALL